MIGTQDQHFPETARDSKVLLHRKKCVMLLCIGRPCEFVVLVFGWGGGLGKMGRGPVLRGGGGGGRSVWQG